jgi:hypothetical protein
VAVHCFTGGMPPDPLGPLRGLWAGLTHVALYGRATSAKPSKAV